MDDTEILMTKGKKKEALERITQLGVEIENQIFALYLIIKHFKTLDKYEEIKFFESEMKKCLFIY